MNLSRNATTTVKANGFKNHNCTGNSALGGHDGRSGWLWLVAVDLGVMMKLWDFLFFTAIFAILVLLYYGFFAAIFTPLWWWGCTGTLGNSLCSNSASSCDEPRTSAKMAAFWRGFSFPLPCLKMCIIVFSPPLNLPSAKARRVFFHLRSCLTWDICVGSWRCSILPVLLGFRLMRHAPLCLRNLSVQINSWHPCAGTWAHASLPPPSFFFPLCSCKYRRVP